MAQQVSLFQQFKDSLASNSWQGKSFEAKAWFIRHLHELSGKINRNKLLMDDRLVRAHGRPQVGKMCLFVYNAKHKDSLPYFDRFPLVLMMESTPDGFTGLNLHYLHPLARAAFLDKLLALDNGPLSDTTKLKLKYSFLKKAATLSEFAPCYKRYLTDHVQSRISVVLGSDFPVACFLPTENFSGASKDKVWRDTKKRIK